MTQAFALNYTVKDNTKIGTKLSLDLDNDLSGEVTFEVFSELIRAGHIKIAKKALREEQSRGFDKKPITRTDSVSGRKEELVKPFGRIQYFSRLSDLEVLLKVYEAIEKRSPVRTGLYKNSNYVFANNKLVAKNYQEFFKFVNGTKKNGVGEITNVRFVNVTPYAARLEYSGTRRGLTGKTKGTNISKGKKGKSRKTGNQFKKPNGAYYLASRSASAVKGFFSSVKYEFIPNGFNGITFDSKGMMRNSYANTPKNIAKRRVGKPYVYPSLVFRISKLGIVRN